MSSPDLNTDDVPEEGTEEQKPPLSLEIRVESPNACQRHVVVTVSREDIERYINEAFDELKPKAEVPGFRPGRAPRKLVESRFREQVVEQVKGSLVMDSIAQISEEQNFSAISEPDFDFDAISIPDEGPLTYEFDLEVRPEFEMPDWKGLSLEQPVRQYDKEAVDRQLKELLGRHGQLVPHDGPAEAEDYVTVDVAFRHDGKVVSKLKEETVRIRPVLSFRDARLEEFDKLMSGAKADDKRTAKLTISDSSDNAALRGQEVDAELEVLDVKKLELPALNPDFLERIGGFRDEDDLRDAVREAMERQFGYHQQRRIREQITSELTRTADWELPQEMLRRQTRRELERAVLELRSAGFTNEVIEAHANQIRQNSLTVTATSLKEHFILERIAEEHKLDVAPEDYDEEIRLIADQQDESPRKVRARLEKRGQMDALRNQIVERKAIELITSQAKLKDVPFEAEANDTAAVDFAVGGGQPESEIPEAKRGGESQPLREAVDHT